MRSRPTQSSAVTRPFAAGQGSATAAGCVSGSALQPLPHEMRLCGYVFGWTDDEMRSSGRRSIGEPPPWRCLSRPISPSAA